MAGTSKAAIRFFTRIAALEGAPDRIRVNSISPGAIATPRWASTVLFLVSDDARHVTGADLPLDDGFSNT